MNPTNHAMNAGPRADRSPRSLDKAARVAGLLYLLELPIGLFSLIYVPAQIHVHGDALATVQNLLRHEFLFRLDVVVSALGAVIGLIVPIALYKLLSPVSKSAAALMLAFGVVFIPIGLLATANQLDVLSLLNGAGQPPTAISDPLVAQVMSLLGASAHKTLVAELFWGLWLFPFGYLVWKSGFLPKLLGFFLMLGCFSYLTYFLAGVFFPAYSVPGFVLLPASICEIGTMLWLLFAGARNPRLFSWNKSPPVKS